MKPSPNRFAAVLRLGIPESSGLVTLHINRALFPKTSTTLNAAIGRDRPHGDVALRRLRAKLIRLCPLKGIKFHQLVGCKRSSPQTKIGNYVINLQTLSRIVLRLLGLGTSHQYTEVGANQQEFSPSASATKSASCDAYDPFKSSAHLNSDPDQIAAIDLPGRNAHRIAFLRYPIRTCLDIEEDPYRGIIDLHRAAALGNFATVRKLVATGSDINARAVPSLSKLLFMPEHMRAYSLTPLFLAAINGHVDIIKYLVNEGAELQLYLCPSRHEEAGERIGMTALIVAARANQQAVVDLLLSAGVDVDGRDLHGATALVWAAFDGHLAMVKRLLEAGADINARLNYCRADRRSRKYQNCSALFMAIDQGCGDVVAFLTSMDAENVGESY